LTSRPSGSWLIGRLAIRASSSLCNNKASGPHLEPGNPEQTAENRDAGTGVGQVLLHNESLNRGYLFWDADADGDFDSSVILEGCGHAEDFSARNLI